MGNDYSTLGKASLWASLLGIVLPGCLTILPFVGVLYLTPHTRMGMGPPTPAAEAAGWTLVLSAVLFVLLELIAFGCGIAASRTATGRAGLVISGVVLPLAVSVFTLLWLKLR